MEQVSGARRIDVLIAGAGFAGLSLAIALRQALGPSFAVAVADPALARAPAIRARRRSSRRRVGCSRRSASGSGRGGAQPILDMVVTDSRLDDAMRPTFLTFDGEVAPGEPFAHMIENGPLLAALLEKAKAEGVELLQHAGRASCEAASDRIDVR